MNNGVDKNLLKIRIKSLGLVLSWAIGVLFLIAGFLVLIVAEFIPALVMFAMGIILIPPAVKIVENKLNYRLTVIKKAIILIVCFFIVGFTISPSKSSETAPLVVEQRQVLETKELDTVKEDDVVIPESAIQSEVVPSEQKTEERKLYTVSKVVDGDTLAVDIDGKQVVLRLIGINTPETVDPRKPVECFGSEASTKAKEILTGKKVQLEADSITGELDKYNRTLRYVILEDGTNFNKLMIEEGYAYEYTYNTPYKYQADFKDAQQKAREAKRGLWAEDACNGNLTKQMASTVPTIISTPQPQKTPTPIPTAPKSTGSSGGSCAGKKTCGQMASCEEATFYLKSCGVGGLDRDKDGIPCETICN